MSVRLRLIAPAAAAVVLAGCASATDGTALGGPTSGSAPSTGGAPTTGGAPSTGSAPSTGGQSSSSNGFPQTVSGLAVLLLKGNTSIKGAHLELVETAGSTSVQGIGDETLSNGKLTAMDLSETVESLALRFIIVDGKFYAKLPPSENPTDKPWVLISPDTTDSTLSQIYSSFQTAIQTGAGESVVQFVQAAGSVQLLGTEQLDGVSVGHYKVNVSVAKLPSTFKGKDELQKLGLDSIPVEVYVDEQGRPRKVTEQLTVSGQSINVRITLTKIDVPVSISAPPSSQVGIP